MKSRWSTVEPFEPDRDYLVFASDISPSSRRATGRLFRGATATKRQLRAAEGLVGFSLLARPLMKQYATMSIWNDEAALAAFAESPPHGELMRALAPDMAASTFVRWTITGRDGRPSWKDALARLRAAAREG